MTTPVIDDPLDRFAVPPNLDRNLQSEEVNATLRPAVSSCTGGIEVPMVSVVLEPDGEDDREQAGIASAISSAVRLRKRPKPGQMGGRGADTDH